MNYLARQEIGKPIQVYECDAPIIGKPFYPRLGNNYPGATSTLCNRGYMAISYTASDAVRRVMEMRGEE